MSRRYGGYKGYRGYGRSVRRLDDEGFSSKYCSSCDRRTEHEFGLCIPCSNRNKRRFRNRKQRRIESKEKK